MLETRFSQKYDCNTVECVNTFEEDGVNYETYRVLVTKNDGELQDFIEVDVPATLTDAETMNDPELLEILQSGLVTRARNNHRSLMVSEEEKAERIESKKDKLAAIIEQLKAAGMSEDEIKNYVG